MKTTNNESRQLAVIVAISKLASDTVDNPQMRADAMDRARKTAWQSGRDLSGDLIFDGEVGEPQLEDPPGSGKWVYIPEAEAMLFLRYRIETVPAGPRVNVTVRLSPTELEAIDALARTQDRTRAQVMRRFLTDRLHLAKENQ